MTASPTDDDNQQTPPGGDSEPVSEPPQPPARPAPRLLEFLVCPVTKSTLQLSADRTELISRRARLAYPIRDGIPLLTLDTARELTDDDLRK